MNLKIPPTSRLKNVQRLCVSPSVWAEGGGGPSTTSKCVDLALATTLIFQVLAVTHIVCCRFRWTFPTARSRGMSRGEDSPLSSRPGDGTLTQAVRLA